jgi:hypothetical protein
VASRPSSFLPKRSVGESRVSTLLVLPRSQVVLETMGLGWGVHVMRVGYQGGAWLSFLMSNLLPQTCGIVQAGTSQKRVFFQKTIAVSQPVRFWDIHPCQQCMSREKLGPIMPEQSY